MRADSIASVISNYPILKAMWEDAADIITGIDNKAQIRGMAAQVECCEFFFGLVLEEMLLCHTDNLSRTLPTRKCLAAEGQAVTQMTVKAIQTISDAEYHWHRKHGCTGC